MFDAHMSVRVALAAVLIMGGLAACSPEDQPAPGPTGAPSAGACTPANLRTFRSGVLTIGTDNPAYPPWFDHGDASNGKGFESAVAYAVAAKLGYPKDKVNWTLVGFEQSFAPGDKKFDFDINQVSITDTRKRAVDFSDPYYTVTQGVIALKSNKIAGAKTVADLAGAKLGAQVTTTSLTVIKEKIRPRRPPAVFNTTNDSKSALENGTIDGLVVDLPTAFELTAAEIDDSVIVGQLPSDEPEQFGLVLAKGSPLLSCVNQAIGALKSGGDLQKLTDQYLTASAGAPKLG
jgi:polar amino acid transport system substrate-binding protein